MNNNASYSVRCGVAAYQIDSHSRTNMQTWRGRRTRHRYAPSPSFFLIPLTNPQCMKKRRDVSKCPLPLQMGNPTKAPDICADEAHRRGEGTSPRFFFLTQSPRAGDDDDTAPQPPR